ncbi:MAG: Crp/Fnr family transcriptional regulator [Arcobacteraceae bacterium]|jgi:CRP/FNR family transcriptional regulator|nr:Crp/Fnr family transcriptional regulator [Arcobacteraceae bacterium]
MLEKIIQTINLFKNTTHDELELLASISSASKYEKDALLYYEAESTDKLLFLVSGLLKVYKIDKYDNEIFLYYIYPNNMISELSNLEENRIRCFSNTVFIEDSIMLSIDFKKFKELFLYKNELTQNFIQELIYKNQQLQCIINRELVFDATSKVAYMLINDLDIFNKLKRNEVSLLLHIQPETLSRVLKKLQRNEVISIDKGIIEIEKYDELKFLYTGLKE